MGLTEPALFETDEQLASKAFRWNDPALKGRNWVELKTGGWLKLNIEDAPLAQGGFRTPSGKCKFYSDRLKKEGLDPLPDYLLPYESANGTPELAARCPLAMISPPARNFFNSSFVNVESLRSTEGQPHLDIHPADAKARHRRGYARMNLQRSRFNAGVRPRHRTRTRRRRRRIVDLVEKIVARWQQRKSGNEPGFDRSRGIGHVL